VAKGTKWVCVVKTKLLPGDKGKKVGKPGGKPKGKGGVGKKHKTKKRGGKAFPIAKQKQKRGTRGSPGGNETEKKPNPEKKIGLGKGGT